MKTTFIRDHSLELGVYSYFNLTKTLQNDNKIWYLCKIQILEDTKPHIQAHFEKDSRSVTKTNSLSEIRQFNL